MPSPNEISISKLSRLIGTPNCPILIDVSIDADFNADPYLIPTATRHLFDNIAALVPTLQGKSVVVICQKGKKLSQGTAAILRGHGIAAEYLAGGNYAWRDAGELRIENAAIPRGPQGHSIWVTRHRPKIDRIACPWLIRRFIDPNAQFLFVSPSEVTGVAERFNATPFDIDNVHFSHRDDRCSFDAFCDDFNLHSPALDRLATIIRGADTNRHDLAPECAGLVAASLGLSRMYSNDHQQLDAGMTLYDSFYRWARDATGEKHDWPNAKNKV
ncbi:sulfurtransferase [Amylibacter kogurei]|uniref:Sulfurtransferase n=1 Tax=Paramylibacter kogurei TaxID=1889778 RepID=A0A2G5K3H4_9RHOB|nr:sulfurtransferase/chromate resistance protein [Amylibacter kogurei]PIB24061.1 sulfurtransferase [Amylibacter kogurei]